MTAQTIPTDRPFTWSIARASGISRGMIEDLVHGGQLRRVLRNVYVDARVPDTVETRALAAGLVVTPVGIFVDRTAAWIHGVDVFFYRELEILPPLECFVPPGHHRVARRECRGGERDLLPRDIVVISGVQVTTPLRTCMDLGCRLPRWNALAALDMFMRNCAITPAQLYVELPRFAGRRGVVQLRCLIPLADPRSESTGESWVRLVIHDDGLPAPTLQYWVNEHGVPLYRLDLAYPRSKVAVEYDGVDFHDKTEEQRAADRERRDWLRRHGWTVIVVTKDDFTAAARTRWLDELRQALQFV
ncbi:MAG TPA: DUF559 domain-containing protein [Nocardioidaceae bacterium]|nr:DUF559 domain-containing protein [Nocardioidaceae bacterium]